MKRAPTVADVKAAESRSVEWSFKLRAAVTAVSWGALGAWVFAWLAVERTAPGYLVLAASCLLLLAYGLHIFRHRGPAPDKRNGFRPQPFADEEE